MLNLRHTRISDRVLISNSYLDPDDEIIKSYKEINYTKESEESAKKYISEFLNGQNTYEGTTKPSARPAQSFIKYRKYFKASRNKNNKKYFLFYSSSFKKKDNGIPDPLLDFFYLKNI